MVEVAGVESAIENIPKHMLRLSTIQDTGKKVDIRLKEEYKHKYTMLYKQEG